MSSAAGVSTGQCHQVSQDDVHWDDDGGGVLQSWSPLSVDVSVAQAVEVNCTAAESKEVEIRRRQRRRRAAVCEYLLRRMTNTHRHDQDQDDRASSCLRWTHVDPIYLNAQVIQCIYDILK